MTNLPPAFIHCMRCDKELLSGDTHTCTPSAKFRAGMLEGMKIVSDEIESRYDSNEMAMLSSYGYHEEVLTIIDRLMQKYAEKGE